MKKKLTIITILLVSIQISNGQGFFGEGSSTMADIFNSNCCLLGQYKILGSVGAFYNKTTYLDNNQNEMNYDRYGLNYNITAKFYKEFQLRLSLFSDLNKDKTKPKWLSNMYYAIGNYNWRKNTFSYGYENYQPNRFDGSYNFFDNMKRGFFFTSYSIYGLSQKSKLKLDGTSQIYISPFIRYQFEYTDRFGQKVLGHNKTVLGASARYVVWKNLYVEGAVFYYPVKASKMPWDPDFTYGFGLFNWQSFKLNLSYGNWIANRFPWNNKEMKNDFTNGEFKVLFSFIW
jgi:hypothetical protein